MPQICGWGSGWRPPRLRAARPDGMARGAPQTWGREARGGDRDGKIGRRQDVGRDYAIAAVEAMIADGRNVLGYY
jgi:hypothetical protein